MVFMHACRGTRKHFKNNSWQHQELGLQTSRAIFLSKYSKTAPELSEHQRANIVLQSPLTKTRCFWIGSPTGPHMVDLKNDISKQASSIPSEMIVSFTYED